MTHGYESSPQPQYVPFVILKKEEGTDIVSEPGIPVKKLPPELRDAAIAAAVVELYDDGTTASGSDGS